MNTAIPLPLAHQMVHTANIVLGLPHIRQLGSPCPLLGPLDNLDARHILTVDFKGHLRSDLGQLASQQDARLDAPSPDPKQDAAKRLGRFLGRHHQNIAHACRLRVVLGEELGACPRGIHLFDLVLVVRRNGIGRRADEVWVRGFDAVGHWSRRSVDGEAGAELFAVGWVLTAGAAFVGDCH